MDQKTPWYISSSGNGLSATLGGLSAVGLAQAIAVVLGLVGHPVSQDAVAGGITTLISAGGALLSAYGVIMKAVRWAKVAFAKQPPQA